MSKSSFWKSSWNNDLTVESDNNGNLGVSDSSTGFCSLASRCLDVLAASLVYWADQLPSTFLETTINRVFRGQRITQYPKVVVSRTFFCFVAFHSPFPLEFSPRLRFFGLVSCIGLVNLSDTVEFASSSASIVSCSTIYPSRLIFPLLFGCWEKATP